MFYNNHEAGYILTNIFHVKRNHETAYSSALRWTALSFRISGSTVYEFDGKKITADAGCIVYIPENARFKRISMGEELIVLHLKCLGPEGNEIQVFQPDDPDALSGFFFKMYQTWEQGAPGYRHHCTAVLYQLLAGMEAFVWNDTLSKNERIIKKSLLYMNMHYNDPSINISNIALQSNISEVYFRKLYKEIFGISPCRALRNMRIELAKELLQSGYFSILEVAEKCGFENCKYFSTLFRKMVGVAPSEYVGFARRQPVGEKGR